MLYIFENDVKEFKTNAYWVENGFTTSLQRQKYQNTVSYGVEENYIFRTFISKNEASFKVDKQI